MTNDKDMRKQEDKIIKEQKERTQRIRIDALLRIYQDATSIEKTEDKVFGKSVKIAVLKILSDMVTIVEKDTWYSIHPHEAFPKIDIRMLICECPASSECPYLLAVLRKTGMSREDYVNYRKRAGMMIITEYKRKLGKHR